MIKSKRLEFTSEHWQKLEQLQTEIDIVNTQIKSNFATIKELQELKKTQLKELKILYKTKFNEITQEHYNDQKKIITDNIATAMQNVLDELTYNTSFIVAKYDELATLKQHKKIRKINKLQKQELQNINAQIKKEKNLVTQQIQRILKVYIANGVAPEKIAALKAERQKIHRAIERRHQKVAEHLEESLIKSQRSLKYIVLATALAVAVPLLLLTGLLLNYLVYFPKMHHGDAFAFNSTSAIAAFTISTIMAVTIIVVITFLIKRSVKRIVIDHTAKTSKIMSIGFVASFFDILGVGSFATSLGLLKATKSIDDDKMVPGTLNMAFCVPILMEGSFLVSAVQVDIVTLVVLIVCAVVGSYLGAMIVNKVNTKAVKLCISVALFIAGIIMILTTKQVHVITAGTLTGLTSWKLAVAFW